MAGGKSLPGLFRIEKESLIIAFELIHKSSYQNRFYPIAKTLLNDVAIKEKTFIDRKEEILSLEQVVSKHLLPYLDKNIEEAMKEIGTEIIEMVTVSDFSIRDEVKKLLKQSLKAFDKYQE